jgi:hypothetical protein
MHAIIASPLARKAVLVSVSISQWTARRLDRKVTDEVNAQHNATSNAGRYNKLLIDPTRLKKIGEIVSKARGLHYTLTRPWQDEGARILPNQLFEKFANEFRQIKRDFEAAAEEFCDGYPAYIEERKRELGDLFKADDYPSVEDIRSKFKLDMSVMPLPDANDFRSDLDPDLVEDLRAEIAKSVDAATDGAQQATVKQLAEVVGHMAKKLREFSEKKEGQRTFFADSLVGNVRELADLLPAFNLKGDPELNRIAARVKSELCGTEPDELREDAKARDSVRKSAEQIVAEVEKLGLFA